MQFISSALTDVGKKRTKNEDSFFVNDEIGVYVVADGMGGHSGGAFASKLTIGTISEVLDSMNKDPEATVISGVNSQDSNAGDRLKYAIEVASQKVFDQALYDPELRGMGTTVVALCLEGELAHVAHVGDSRLYLWRKQHLAQITKDHSLVSEQAEAGIIDKADLKKHKLKNIITRSVGYQEEVDVELQNFVVQPGDRFLLCSDGLSNMVDDDVIKKSLQRSHPDEACRELVSLANQNGGDDNITVVVCFLESCE